ncbi:MAG TPA: nucleotidyltransferase domain-containing protein [Mycobacteriales bacterium]|nr:nucleotidyltransferase domain-containing protein [Mycobacteriales bacterium]
MDVSDPGRALATGLTMPILRAMSSRSNPTTAAQIYRVMQQGTEAGVRRAIERLAAQGVVLGEPVGDRTVYSLNHDHVLDRAIRALLRAPEELPRRLRVELADWSIQPVSAALYGSAARRDGDADSDIDILLVRPVLGRSATRDQWVRQVHQLREAVRRWTGNRVQITDRSRTTLRRLAAAREPIVDQWLTDAVVIAGQPLDELVDVA